MSITAISQPLSLFGPVPQAPEFGLLAQLERLGMLSGPDDDHWTSGSNVWFYPCVQAFPHDPCSAGTNRVKDDGDGAGDQASVLAFTAYATIACSSISVGRWDEFIDRLEASFKAVEGAAVEAELANGTAIFADANPYFGGSGVTTPAGTSGVTPEVGLRWLEYAIGQSQRQGLIHAPPEVAAAWRTDELTVTDGVLHTVANGTPVIAGPGYQGSHPYSVSAPAAGSSWAYATGAVQVRQGDVIRPDQVESLDRTDNSVVARVERDYWASFDPCVQAAVLVDWTP